jgi:hypothetical protein
MAKGGQVATTVLVIEAAASLYAAFCPSWFTVRSTFFHDQSAREGNVRAIRQGEIAATLLTIPTGYASSILVGSWLPLIGATAISVLMIGGYEYSIRNPASDVPAQPPAYMRAMDWGAAKA